MARIEGNIILRARATGKTTVINYLKDLKEKFDQATVNEKDLSDSQKEYWDNFAEYARENME